MQEHLSASIKSQLISVKSGLSIVYFLLFSCFISGCATHFAAHDLSRYNSSLVWPAPPQTPRIQLLTCISTPADLGINKSWVKRTIDTLFGKEELQEILLRPYGVYVNSGKLYVTDPGARILHVFDFRKKNYFSIRDTGSEEFQSPIGVAADNNGEIYMTDSMLKKVLVFNSEGEYLRAIGSSDEFKRPTGIAISGDRVYIIDTHAHHVLIYNKYGRFLFSFGKNGSQKGEFNYPTNIFIDKNGILYITDSMNFRVQIFDRDGNFLSTFGKLGDGSGDLSKPKGIAVDSEGHIYVADALFDTVQIFNRDGKLLLGFGNTGKEQGRMILPAGVFIDQDDRIYLADSYNRRIQVFQYLKEKE
jgi:sugar lactone lactonase YvrE